MLKQKTLKESFSLRGKGLHTGLDLTVTFNPAPDNHGYKIQRTDFIFPGTPDWAPRFTWLPILRCPAMPTCPPNIHHSPTLVEPAMPTWAAMTVCEPISSLWAIWTRLSNFTPL